MFVLYLLVSVGCCTTRASIINPDVTPALNWWDARSLCKSKFKSDLLKPDTKLNISSLVEGERHWVGAVETYRWRWTDGSYLNGYRGYADLSIQESEPNHLSNNSVYTCFNICKKSGLIGLSGENCYCFKNESIRTSEEDADPCPGSTDPSDKCGNKTGLSVYKTDRRFSEINNGKCAVVRKKRTGEVSVRSSGCTRNLYSLCNSGNKDICSSEICVSPHRSNWHSANRACQLITITNRNIEKLKVFLKEIKKRTYWIGLQKIISKRWVDGTTVLGVSSYKADNQLCLATFKFNMAFVYEWLPCQEQHSALCAAENINTGGSTEGSETAAEDEMKNHRIMYVCIGVGVGLFILFAVALSGTFFLKRRIDMGRNCATDATYTVPQRSPDDVKVQPYDDLHVYVNAQNVCGP